MGRTIVADDRVEDAIGQFVAGKTWSIGVLVGQATPQKDFVIHLAKTPPDEAPQQSDARDEDAVLPTATERKPVKPAKNAAETLDSIDEKWVAQHAKQVTRMLPGGLEVIGVFATASADMLKKSQAKLRQVLFATHKLLSRYKMASMADGEAVDRTILQICLTTGKLTCRTCDVANPRSEEKPADLKFQSVANRWHQVNCRMCLDWRIPITMETLATNLTKQLQTALHPICMDIANSLTTINGRMRANEEMLVATSHVEGSTGKAKRGRKADVVAQEVLNVELFTQTTETKEIKAPIVDKCGAVLSLRGTMQGRAYVHSKATVEEAITMLKKDLICTLLTRCEIVCEDESIYEHERDPATVLETPLRVFVPLPGTTVCVCDYIFSGESLAGCVEPLRDLLSIDVNVEQIESDCESFPGEDDLQDEHLSRCSSQSELEIVRERARGYLVPVLGGVFAVAAVVMSYLYVAET